MKKKIIGFDLKGSPVHEAPTNAESQKKVEPHWVYHTQSYPALQKTVSTIRIHVHKVTRQQLYH